MLFLLQATSKVDPDVQKQKREEQARKFKEIVSKKREEKVRQWGTTDIEKAPMILIVFMFTLQLVREQERLQGLVVARAQLQEEELERPKKVY